ncbi:MAG: preprotein translocase subunit SecG, partial [Nitrospinota bacterium]|nr:preprotein translocase subunit SecG [Nitrospinota bacterium]
VLHIIAAVTLVTVILFFQQGKGAQIGSSFGGSSQTLFGSRGPAGAMAKVTTAAAIMFMLTSITLSIMSKGAKNQSIITEADAPMTLPVSLPGANTPASEAPSAPMEGSAPVAPGDPDVTAPVAAPAEPSAPVGPVDAAPASDSPAAGQ